MQPRIGDVLDVPEASDDGHLVLIDGEVAHQEEHASKKDDDAAANEFDRFHLPFLSGLPWGERSTVLCSNAELGISIVYITHDLATAYQISDNIVVLYRGSVAEAGDVELVVKQPRHPYTQLLVSSIPQASAARTWMAENAVGPAAVHDVTGLGCKFAARCPSVASRCLEAAPPLFQTDRHRAVSCYLHQDAPSLPPEAMVSAFAEPVSKARSG